MLGVDDREYTCDQKPGPGQAEQRNGLFLVAEQPKMIQADGCYGLSSHHTSEPHQRTDPWDEHERGCDHHDTDQSSDPDPPRQFTWLGCEIRWKVVRGDCHD